MERKNQTVNAPNFQMDWISISTNFNQIYVHVTCQPRTCEAHDLRVLHICDAHECALHKSV